MTKILFIANAVVNFTKYSFDSFYEGFINSLTRNGNDVFFLKANLFLNQDKNSQNFQLSIKKNKFIKYIKDLSPELIITFNNNITKEILDCTDCPVVFWSSESYDFLVSKNLIKKYESRYLFLHFDETIKKQFVKNLSLNPKKNITTFLATDIRTKNLKQDKNISFLGTIHGNNYEFGFIKKYITTQESRDQVLEFLGQIKASPLKKIDLHKLHSKITKNSLMNVLSRYQRLTTLDALHDLGLHIYGDKKWLDIFDTFPYLSLSYKDGYVCTLDEVSNLYNSSKISINAPHLQSESFLSYRCPDILASNAILLNKGKINTQYDPKGLIPHFNSPNEARELAIEMLKETNKRKDIVGYCHELVEQKLRFEHRLKELEQLLPIKLLRLKKKGKYTFIDIDCFLPSSWKIISNCSTSAINFIPKSLVDIACKLSYPIRGLVPEDIKRACRNKK